MSYTKRPYDPTQKIGVNYFKHLSKTLMVPYGKAYGVMTDREILEKCTVWNCEWLTRPNTAVSEFANSIYDNMSTLKAYEGKVFDKSIVDYMATKLVPLKTTLQRFNKKDRDVAEEPSQEDLVALMKTMSGEKLGQITKELFAASGAMYQIATQMMTLQTLLRHPDAWANKHREDPEVSSFKSNPTPQGMRTYLKSQLLQANVPSSYAATATSVWDMPSQSSDAREPSSSVWELEDDEEDTQGQDIESSQSEDNEEEIQPAKKRSRRNLFEDFSVPPDEEEETQSELELFVTQSDPKPTEDKSPKKKKHSRSKSSKEMQHTPSKSSKKNSHDKDKSRSEEKAAQKSPSKSSHKSKHSEKPPSKHQEEEKAAEKSSSKSPHKHKKSDKSPSKQPSKEDEKAAEKSSSKSPHKHKKLEDYQSKQHSKKSPNKNTTKSPTK